MPGACCLLPPAALRPSPVPAQRTRHGGSTQHSSSMSAASSAPAMFHYSPAAATLRPAPAACARSTPNATLHARLAAVAAAARRLWRMRKKSKGCFLRWRQVLNRGASARRRCLRWAIAVAVAAAVAEVEDQQTRTRYVFVFILDTLIRMLQPRMCVIRVTMCRMSPCQYIFVNSFQHVISMFCRL